jgi:hypothetical protein
VRTFITLLALSALVGVAASAQSVAAKSRRDFHQSRARSESKGVVAMLPLLRWWNLRGASGA